MGGLFSGRYPIRSLVEAHDVLDVTKLAHYGAFDGQRRVGQLEFRSGLILDVVTHAGGIDILAPVQRTDIEVVRRPTPTATYAVWLCPQCKDGARKLYVSVGHIACRTCLDLVYERCRYSHRPFQLLPYRMSRLRRRIGELRRAAACDDARHSERRERRVAELDAQLGLTYAEWSEHAVRWAREVEQRARRSALRLPLLDIFRGRD